jgi:AcrR family transcriptional regulator
MAAVGDGSAEHATAHALLWERRPQPRRGPRPALTLEVIADTGIEIADADGIPAVTMQRVAESLGVTKMSLYRYVPGKVELVALMTDMALGAPAPLGSAGWRPTLHEWAIQMFHRFWRHPWALEVTVGARAMGPNEIAWLEQAVAALDGTGLDGGEMLDVAVTLIGHVRTIAQHGAAMGSERPEQEMDSALAAIVRHREDRFPALAAALESAATHGSQDQALDFGLNRILDGVELLIATRAGVRPHPG